MRRTCIAAGPGAGRVDRSVGRVLGLALLLLASAGPGRAQGQPAIQSLEPAAARTLELRSDPGGKPLCAFAYESSDLLLDSGGALTIEDVVREDVSRRFLPNWTRVRPLLVVQGALWVRFRLRSGLPDTRTYWGSAGRWGVVELFSPGPGGWRVVRSGAFVPLQDRSAPEAHVNRYIVKLVVPPGPSERTVFLRLTGDLSLTPHVVSPALHAFLHPEDAKGPMSEVLLGGLTIGVLLGLALYHLILFALVREKVYLFFALALAGRAWLFGIGYRFLLEFVWPGAARFDYYLARFGIPVWVCAFFVFFMTFLKTRTRMPRVHLLLCSLILLSFLSPLLFWLRIAWFPTMEAVFRIGWAVIPVVVAAAELRRRSKEALIFLLANVLMLAYFLAYALAMLGVDVYDVLPPEGFHIGILLSAVLFSIAVAEQMRELRMEKEQAQRDEAEAEVLLHRQDMASARLGAELSEARFQVLKNQLRPHFLFNTLSSIAGLMRVDVDQAESKLALLAGLLRTTLDDRNADEVRLEEEVSFVRRYLEIEKTRFPDRLRVIWEVAASTLNALVPHLVLQPLVENAVRHGVAPRPGPGTVWIRSARDCETLCLQVRDDGPGLRG
ncbi:MAG TPA: 7TM diverse intracellular signaling domain-containing protein, partial [Thermoanaerobaculaceae bacterium]|nr:7TM diverse intracellular signaling domain-containing protein [Thermoanaerobaculaceae bacterium]